jgi:hypothetical protein
VPPEIIDSNNENDESEADEDYDYGDDEDDEDIEDERIVEKPKTEEKSKDVLMEGINTIMEKVDNGLFGKTPSKAS